MDLSYPPEAAAYRETIRQTLLGLMPPGWGGLGALLPDARSDFLTSWRASLLDHGLLAPSWPVEYGGGGLSLLEQSMAAELLAAHGLPQYPLPTDSNGMVLLGPTLLAFGTEEQKAEFLPGTLSGEIRWAQGYSEPEAGSDLFGLRTRAEFDGNVWRVTGQKVWQTAGTSANWMFTLARTDPSTAGGKGLSFLLIPLQQAGVEVRGIRNMAGETEFAEVFLDDAKVDSRHVVGGVGNGAKVALGLLGFERGAGGMAAVTTARIELDRLIVMARSRGAHRDHALRRRIAGCYADIHLMHCLALRSLAAGVNGDPPGPESSITKMVVSQYRQRVTELALDILGPDCVSLVGSDVIDPLKAQPLGTDPFSTAVWITDALHARPTTVYGGSIQMQRNTIGERVLGLPREPARPVPPAR